MILRIPAVPSAALTENRRRGWQENSGKKQSMKEEFYWLVYDAFGTAWNEQDDYTGRFEGRVDISYRFHFTDARMRDRDGLAQRLKVIQDMLCLPKGKDISYKLGIIVDDSDKWINRWEILPTIYKAESEMLEIEITEASDG